MKTRLTLALVASTLTLSACGKKDEPSPISKVSDLTKLELRCSYAPSQSALVAQLSGAAGGSAAVTAALAQALGLSVVTHSSGALILSGSAGYIAGTIGTAAAGPIVIAAGILVAGTSGVIELVCAPQNHPELVAKVEAAATEFAIRSTATTKRAASSIASFTAEKRLVLVKAGNDAFDYANQKSAEISSVFGR